VQRNFPLPLTFHLRPPLPGAEFSRGFSNSVGVKKLTGNCDAKPILSKKKLKKTAPCEQGWAIAHF